MKLAILSRARHAYSTRRLKLAAQKRGHKVLVLDTTNFGIALEQEHPELYFRSKRLSSYDAVIPRIGASITYFGTAVVRQFEQMGVYCLNPSNGISNSRDKLRSLQMLSRHDIGIPPTTFVRDRSDILPAIVRVGGAPVIIKLLEGTQGVGVILAETMKVAEAIIETLHSAKQNVLIQGFVSESRGRDIRAFVVGDRVVAAMRRVAQTGEFRSNVHRGGKAEPVELDPEFERTAVRAAQIMGLKMAGVDMLESVDGPKVMEVNSSPGLQGIEAATRIDVADSIIQYVEDQVAFPELDLRQRLTMNAGYGVAELMVPRDSDLVGRCIADSGFQEKDIVVLKLERRDKSIPNPKGSRVLRAHDRLLCFGKLEEMRALLPKRKRRRSRKLTKHDILPPVTGSARFDRPLDAAEPNPDSEP
ncbi:MAG: RimK family alpha-L-glutamate ligase [Polyangiaceae bacterium]|nr:RimK family alpha-L-glutamate ligase [Polyangiaceae bacterium]MCW5791005.1 RimK family alpha-L-glutamate ligase [Polyangiaceae bacterium]